VYYHDHNFQHQRHRERTAEMRNDYRRFEVCGNPDWNSNVAMNAARQIGSMWRSIHRRSEQHTPAYRA
jgi:hypothetical protein